MIVIASIIFYSYSDWTIFKVLAISILINFGAALFLTKCNKMKKLIVIVPVVINVGLLLYFKYTNFIISTANVKSNQKHTFFGS